MKKDGKKCKSIYPQYVAEKLCESERNCLAAWNLKFEKKKQRKEITIVHRVATLIISPKKKHSNEKKTLLDPRVQGIHHPLTLIIFF